MSILDFAALEATPLQRDPFDYLVVGDFIRPEAREAIERDFPAIQGPANHRLEEVHPGPAFDAFLEELRGPTMAQRVAAKFGVDLEGTSTTITLRRYAQSSDGNIHTDSWTKLITILVYFNPEWKSETGALRLLRSPTDIEDYAAEVPPLSGTLLGFRRSENSFHGHKRFEGERLMLQMSWVKPTRRAALALRVKRLTTRLMKALRLDRQSNVKAD